MMSELNIIIKHHLIRPFSKGPSNILREIDTMHQMHRKHSSLPAIMRYCILAFSFLFITNVHADTRKVAGQNCPHGYTHVSYNDVKANPRRFCSKLAQWDIARLANGGSMDGAGYKCKFRPSDSRQLGHSLCKTKRKVRPNKAVNAIKVQGSSCPKGYRHASYKQVSKNPKAFCSKLAQWDIARLANGGSMDGAGYQCKYRPSDSRQLGHSLCVKGKKTAVAVRPRTSSLNQAAWVPNSTSYRFGYNSIPNIKISGAPADANHKKFAMLHDGKTYRLYLWKKNTNDTLYQFGFNRATNKYEYGYNSIKQLKIVGMPADADRSSFAMLHDGTDYRLYMRSRSSKTRIYQAAYKAGTNSYIYGHRSIPSMNLTKAPADITKNKRWAMLHDGKAYRLYIGRKGNKNEFYQFAFNRATNSYEYAYNNSIPKLTLSGTPGNSARNSFVMLHDGSAYRFYHRTR